MCKTIKPTIQLNAPQQIQYHCSTQARKPRKLVNIENSTHLLASPERKCLARAHASVASRACALSAFPRVSGASPLRSSVSYAEIEKIKLTAARMCAHPLLLSNANIICERPNKQGAERALRNAAVTRGH